MSPYDGLPMAMLEPIQSNVDQRSFKYMSLVIAHSSNFNEIISKLKARGYECDIETQFLQLGFKSSSSSAPLLHNDKF